MKLKEFLSDFKEIISIVVAVVALVGGFAVHHHFHHGDRQHQEMPRERTK